MHFIKIKEEYLQYLKKNDVRIPNQDYGENKYKPFYILASINNDEDVFYVTQTTSPKPRHKHMGETTDFKKIYDHQTGKYLGATNLNYMFPVLPEYIEHLSMQDIKDMVGEENCKRMNAIKYALGRMELENAYKTLYQLKYNEPENKASKRCLDFKQLEAKMLEYKLREQFYNDTIKVERSSDYSTFLIVTGNNTYEYCESILDNTFQFLEDMSEKIQNEIVVEKGIYLE